MLNNYICALDIGSSKIASCLAQFKKRRLAGMFFDSMPAKGIKDGVIVNSIELVGCVTSLLKNLKSKSGINIKYLCVNISGQDILTKHGRAIIPLAERGNKVIAQQDIERVNEQARILGSSLEEDIIHQIPLGYTIDSKSNIANPLGLYSHRLEVDMYLVCGKLSSIQSLNRVIHQSGYEIKDLFFTGLATSKAVLNRELNSGTTFLCDIGADTTELLLFKDGVLKDIEVLSFGGDYLTRELQDNLKIPLELAEDIKRSYGVIGDIERIKEDKEILLKKESFYKPIKQKLVAEIITSGAKALSGKIKDAASRKAEPYEVDNFVVAGRAVLLEGFIEMLENTLSVPVKLGRVVNKEVFSLIKDESALSGHKYLNYLTCLGMVTEALEAKPLRILPVHQPAKNLISAAVNRFKEVYQEYF